MCRGKSIRSARHRRAPRPLRFELIEPRILLATISGNIFEDLDGDGIKEPGESGLIGKTVYIDADNDGQLDTNAPVAYSNGTDKTITDNSTTIFNISVPTQSSPIVKMAVTVDITHSWVADLDVVLISPSGTRVELFSDINITGQPTTGISVTLDDSAASSITGATGSSITGTWRPEGLLGAFSGQLGSGTWKLEITDDQPGDAGIITNASLRLTNGECAAVSNATGDYSLINVPVGTQMVRQALTSSWEETAPAGGWHSVSVATTSSVVTGKQFGTRVTPGQIGGVVFADYDADGVQDADEPGQSGWTVYIDADEDGALDAGEAQAVSASDGAYLFTNIMPGAYVVREVVPAGWVQTTPAGGGVAVSGGATVTAASAGATQEKRRASGEVIIVAFKGDQGLSNLRQRRRHVLIAGLFDLNRSVDLFSVDGVSLVNVALAKGVNPLKAVDRFSSLSGVAWAQPDYIYDADPRDFTPNDPSYVTQYHHTLMKNNLAWDTTLGSSEVVVAVTDDGVSLSHPDLAPNIWVNSDEVAGNGIDDDANGYVDDVNGWDFSSNDNNPNPVGTSDHGTHVAGIVAARTNNGVGVAGTAGGVKIMPIRFYGSATWTSTIIAKSFRYAADNGAKILSTSYNIDSFVNDSIFASALQYIYDRGVLYFNSAGNGGQLNPPRQVFDQALLVANTTSSDTRSSTSNYGYGIDISAPGSSIYSTLPGNTYGTKSGTSMAAPNAAGAAALIWSAHPTWTREQVAAQLIATADNINAQNPAYVNLLGSGRVNTYRGVTEAIAPPRIRSLAGLPAEGSTTLAFPNSFTLDVANVFNPATVTGGSFELRGNGADDVFGTLDDVLVPLALNTTYRVGTNRLNFSISGVPANDTYRFIALPSLTDPFGQPIDGNANGVGGDAYTRTFMLQGMTHSNTITVVSSQTAVGNFGNADTIAPKVLASSFAFQTDQSVVLTFSEDIAPSITAADLVLQREGGLEALFSPIAGLYDHATNTMTFALSEMSSVLPDGDYVATLSAAGVADAFGNHLDGDGGGLGGTDFQMSFFIFAGDGNHDRLVDARDLYVLASNYLRTGATFAEGDFNYDGVVDASDLTLLAQRWNQKLATTISLPAAETQAPAGRYRSPVRIGLSDPRSLIA